jgi:hypothetical protein
MTFIEIHGSASTKRKQKNLYDEARIYLQQFFSKIGHV